MTVEELEAGADAVHALAVKHGLSFWSSREKEREIAAEVIKAFLSVRDKKNER